MDVAERRGGRVVVRRAEPADGEALCRLFETISMEADLELAVRRAPDFFALYRLQGEAWECWLAETEGGVGGLGAIVARDGYLGGRPTRIGYLGDLRLDPGLQGQKLVPRFYGPALREFGAKHACEVFLTTIIASNRKALRALTGPAARRAGIPAYDLVRRFDIRAVHLTVPLPRLASPFIVRRATPDDVDEIAAFLDDDGRRRPFGYAFPEGELRRRLHEWPGLEISSFYLARDRDGALAGCVAVWDPSRVKRTLVRAYRGRMVNVQRAYNLAAAVLRFSPLPPRGSQLRYAYATHVAVPSGDPRVLRALLHAIYAHERKSDRAFIAFCAYEGDPLVAAFRGFPHTDLAANLYAVAVPGTELPPDCFTPGPPGFEMALV